MDPGPGMFLQCSYITLKLHKNGLLQHTEADTGRADIFMDSGPVKSCNFRAQGIVPSVDQNALKTWLGCLKLWVARAEECFDRMCKYH